jgi:anti-sigma factor RsiW
MDCRDIERNLDAYLDGDLSPADAGAFAGHLRECRTCRRDYGALVAVLTSEDVVSVPAGLRDRIMAALEDTHPTAGEPSAPTIGRRHGRAHTRLYWFAGSGALAACLAFFAIGWFASRQYAPPVAPSPESPGGANTPTTVIVSPWIASSYAQAIAMRGVINPAPFFAQAAAMEQLAATSPWDLAPAVRSVRAPLSSQPTPMGPDEWDESCPAELPVLVPLSHMLGV